jgi:hypothetical protein
MSNRTPILHLINAGHGITYKTLFPSSLHHRLNSHIFTDESSRIIVIELYVVSS